MALEYGQKVYLKETKEAVVIKSVIYHQGNTTYKLNNGDIVSRSSIITELPDVPKKEYNSYKKKHRKYNTEHHDPEETDKTED